MDKSLNAKYDKAEAQLNQMIDNYNESGDEENASKTAQVLSELQDMRNNDERLD